MPNASELLELMECKEALISDLQPYVSKSPRLGCDTLHHPLIIEIFFDPAHCALINERYRWKCKVLDEYETKGDWGGYIAAHERPYRFNALARVLTKVLDEQKRAKLIEDVWSDSENIRQNQIGWVKVWQSINDSRLTMNDKEVAALGAMADLLTVWRGIRNPRYNQRGLSWTVDRDRAVWFARRFNEAKDAKPTLLSGSVAKDKVFAYLVGRNESEIVVLPKHVRQVKKELV